VFIDARSDMEHEADEICKELTITSTKPLGHSLPGQDWG
jgi:hypothetical protein